MLTINTRQSEANPQSFNRYAYVTNDPVNFVDPSGLLMRAIWSRACTDSGLEQSCEWYVSGWYDDGLGAGGMSDPWNAREPSNPDPRESDDPTDPNAPNSEPQRGELSDKVVSCAEKLFGVQMGSYDYGSSRIGFQGYSDKAKSYFDFSSSDGWFDITPNRSLSIQEISGRNNRITGSTGAVPAATFPNEPKTPYIGRDLGGSGRFIEAQFIHELGNSLWLLTGKPDLGKLGMTDRLRNKFLHEDAGVLMENCVFGGKVNDNGTISR